jgi:hypothetical protein
MMAKSAAITRIRFAVVNYLPNRGSRPRLLGGHWQRLQGLGYPAALIRV